MKSHLQFLQYLLDDLSRWCCVDTARDYKTITSRVEEEGESFLTITLPDFANSFQKSLQRGEVRKADFPGFRFRSGLPAFLRGFLSRIFDSQCGTLLEEPDILCIWAVRQICLVYGKVEKDCSEERTFDAYVRYLENESDVRAWDALLNDLDNSKVAQSALPLYFRWTEYQRLGRLMWRDVFTKVDLKSLPERTHTTSWSRSSGGALNF